MFQLIFFTSIDVCLKLTYFNFKIFEIKFEIKSKEKNKDKENKRIKINYK